MTVVLEGEEQELALAKAQRRVADAAYAAYELGDNVFVLCGTPWEVGTGGARMTRDIVLRERFSKPPRNIELTFVVDFEAADSEVMARAVALRTDTGDQFGELPAVIPELHQPKFRRGPTGVRNDRLR